ncbi:MAG: type VI secretion system protein TssA [Candidatus Electrothrix aestuarii]|uniref:Type VI secretion system protein TssA n=1 Tax=Candidatus Electrothrix aestuarii TaxID=3062594 RepID=A0AAU8LU72_9BACT|nr:type VI secretion system protein TssA [Candidatus Electrothrix aestuarii]
MNREQIKNLGKTPIDGDSPVGKDVSYEPNFEELTNELEKLSSPTAEGGVNWERVAELGITILRDESKNLVVACYLNVALLYTENLQGFAVGVHILRNMLDTWWDTMYPPKKRKKGRINTLNWWNEKLLQLLPEQEIETWPSDQRQQLLEDLDCIDALIAEKLEDGPMLRQLKDMISRLVNEEAPPEPAPEPIQEPELDPEPEPEKQKVPATPPEPSEQESKKSKPSSSPQVAPPAEDDKEAAGYLRQGLNLLGRAATQVFQTDMAKPLPYQLNRLVAWSELDGLPPATNNVTMLPPPDEQIVSLLEKMFQNENWENLLEAAESRVREHLFWLDLSYYAFRALKGCGHLLAAQAVETETRLHVLRLPGIELLSFNDERPFVSQQTRDWLASPPPAGQGGGATPSPSSEATGEEQQQEVVQHVEEAIRVSASSGIQEALTWLTEKKKSATSPRQEFMYDVGFCRLLFQADRTDMSLSFAEHLLMLIDQHNLEKWEPKLAVQALVASYQCLLKNNVILNEDEVLLQRKQVMDRLALLAPDQLFLLI